MSKLASVLLVDDDEIANFIHQSLLEEEQLAEQVLTAPNGKKALELIREGKFRANGKPALILLDINMPVMNGHEFLDAFQHLELPKKEHYKIIVLSSSQNPGDIELAYMKGITDYLYKPLEKKKINEMISRYF